MTAYKIRGAARKPLEIPDTVKTRLTGIALIALGVLSAAASNDSGCYDITAAIFFVPVGAVMVFGKNE